MVPKIDKHELFSWKLYLNGLRPCWDGISRVNGEKFSCLFFRIGSFKNFHKKIFTSYVLPQWYGKHRISGRINTFLHRVTPDQLLLPPSQVGSTPFSTGSGRFNACLLPCQLFCPFLLPDQFRVNSVWIFPYEWGRIYHPFLFGTKKFFQPLKSLNLQKYSFEISENSHEVWKKIVIYTPSMEFVYICFILLGIARVSAGDDHVKWVG